MPNVFWFYCVAAIGIALIIITMFIKKNIVDLFSFFLSVTALAYLCEIVILFGFDSYQYKPGLFSDYMVDNIFGHLICNGFFWGGFSLLVAAFSLRYYWILLISAFFMLVEEFFLKMDLYSQHWWKTYMTGICVILFLHFSKMWYQRLKETQKERIRYFSFYFIAWLLLLAPAIILQIMDRQHFGLGLAQNYYRDDIWFDVPYHLILSFVFIFFVNHMKTLYWKFVPFIIVLLFDVFMNQLGILTFLNGWNLFYFEQLRFLCLGLYIVLEKNSLHFSMHQS